MSNMILNKKPLPWVDTVKYLGCQVSNSRDILGGDITAKRARFIDNVHACMQEFHWAHPSILSKINYIYNCNIYGANLYALDSEHLRKLVNSYSVAMRNIWKVPRETHKYIVEVLSGRHLSTAILSN